MRDKLKMGGYFSNRFKTPGLSFGLGLSLCLALLTQGSVMSPARGESAGSGIVGLNYQIGPDGYPTVSDIYANSPADKAGLHAGDSILSVDGKDSRYLGYLQLQSLLTGPGGTQVTLKILSGDQEKKEKTLAITRATVESFNDPNLQKHEATKWHNDGQDKLVELPFILLSRENNHPTLFEFTEKSSDKGVSTLLDKHKDSKYILSQCKIVRISSEDPSYQTMCKYFALSGGYGLVPVYQPWLVTVKAADIIKSLPSQTQLDMIAKNLVHNSIQVQVSHAIAGQKESGHNKDRLNKRPGLSHKIVLKRVYEALAPDSGIVGMGFAAGEDGYGLITQVFAGGPAAKAGIAAGDTLISVNGQNTRYLGLEHIQKAMTGPVGKSIVLEIRPRNALHESAVKNLTLNFESPRKFDDTGLQKLKVATWQRVISTNPDDGDDYELPCCLLARAGDEPTIFEFCSSENSSGLKAEIKDIDEAKSDSLVKANNLKVIRITPADKDFQSLHKYFNLKGNYAALPVYYKGNHKIVNASQIALQTPSLKAVEADLLSTLGKTAQSNNESNKDTH